MKLTVICPSSIIHSPVAFLIPAIMLDVAVSVEEEREQVRDESARAF